MARLNSYPDFRAPSAAPSWPPARLEAFLRRSELFRDCPASARRLASAASVRRLRAGESLCAAGEPARDIWVLLEGRVRVCRPVSDDSAMSLEVMLPGEAFGLPALAAWRYPSTIEAAEPSSAAALARSAVLREMETEPALARSAFRILSRRLSFLEAQLALAHRPVAERLAAALVYLEHKFGRSVPLTRAEIGSLAGTTPESTIRTLRAFSREGSVLLRKGGVEIADLAALRARAVPAAPRP